MTRGYTSIYFGENQLSPSLIGLSPLPTAHPLIFQHQWVRSSILFYQNFNLAMGSSPGFGSEACNYSALLRLGFPAASPTRLNLAAYHSSLTHYAKGTRSHVFLPKKDIVLPLLVGIRFQDLFHSPQRGAFHLSLTVLVHYRSSTYI